MAMCLIGKEKIHGVEIFPFYKTMYCLIISLLVVVVVMRPRLELRALCLLSSYSIA
jgi:hypothetical protein